VRRLREHQFVTLEIDHPPTGMECLVLAIDGNEATLEPVDGEQLSVLSASGRNALLTFQYRSQLISLRGLARRDEVSRDLRFSVTDRVTVPQRRRYARVEVVLPLTLMSLRDEGGSLVAGDPIETRTRDLSADGVLVEELLPPAEQRWRATLPLPDRGPPVIFDALHGDAPGGQAPAEAVCGCAEAPDPRAAAQSGPVVQYRVSGIEYRGSMCAVAGRPDKAAQQAAHLLASLARPVRQK
jgi:hypothetical protein